MVPLALTRAERRLAALAAVLTVATGAVAASCVIAWCLPVPEGELLGATLIGVLLFAPAWAALAAGVRRGVRVREPWRWASVLPLVAAAAALLAVASTLHRRWRRRDAARWSPVR